MSSKFKVIENKLFFFTGYITLRFSDFRKQNEKNIKINNYFNVHKKSINFNILQCLWVFAFDKLVMHHIIE
jgi:hypothetical protein